jgi:hypothetical protein
MKIWMLAMVGLTACVSTNAAVLNSAQTLPQICPDGVVMFTDSSKVGKPYQEVAVLNSKGSYLYTNERKMVESQRKAAAKLGANGVILGTMQEPGTGAKVWSALIGTPADRQGKAVAIFIPGDSARVAAACKYAH